MGRDSTMRWRTVNVSPGYTGLSHFSFSRPGEPRLDDCSRKLRAISPITIAQVCQPDAASRPNMDCAAASSLR